MELLTLPNLLGLAALTAAGYLVFQIDSTQLGTYSSRVVVTLIALATYFGATSLRGIVPTLAAVRLPFVEFLVAALAVALLLIFGWQIRQHWDDEVSSVVKSGWKVAGVVILALVTRVLFSL